MSKHKLRTVLQHGDPDIGAEIECEIVFTFLAGRPASLYVDAPHPEDPSEIDFVSAAPLCNGKPAPFYGAFADMEQSGLDAIASNWLEGDDGVSEAMATVRSDDEAARERAAEMRADR